MNTKGHLMDSKYLDHDIEDWDIWHQKPEYHWVFNKLELALRLGYSAGPCPTLPPKPGYYCVRPIYNLYGMGLYATKQWLNIDDNADFMSTVHPSSFWCKWFDGSHFSVDYEWDNGWKPIFATQGYNDSDDLTHFYKWQRIDPPDIELPGWLNSLQNNHVLNIEFKDSKMIEVHLRLGNLAGDWYGIEHAEELIPVWDSTSEHLLEQYREAGYSYVHRPEDGMGNIQNRRKGFFYK